MLVSHLHQFIYTKTIKTAGTSVESYFERFCMPDGEWRESHVRDEYVSSAGIVGLRGPLVPEGCLWWNHMPAALIRERLGEKIWASYFKFCVVRNPYEKVLSFFYFERHGGRVAAQPGETDTEQFEHWLESAGVVVDRDKYFIDGRMCMDSVIRFEMLHADLQRICTRLSLPWRPDLLPEFKRGIRPAAGEVSAVYSPKAAQIVRNTYALEFEYFGYPTLWLAEGPDLPAGSPVEVVGVDGSMFKVQKALN